MGCRGWLFLSRPHHALDVWAQLWEEGSDRVEEWRAHVLDEVHLVDRERRLFKTGIGLYGSGLGVRVNGRGLGLRLLLCFRVPGKGFQVLGAGSFQPQP